MIDGRTLTLVSALIDLVSADISITSDPVKKRRYEWERAALRAQLDSLHIALCLQDSRAFTHL